MSVSGKRRVRLRLSPDTEARAREIARLKNVSLEVLLIQFLTERLEEEERRHQIKQ